MYFVRSMYSSIKLPILLPVLSRLKTHTEDDRIYPVATASYVFRTLNE